MNDVYQIRKENLLSLVLNKFKGNKAAFSRAAEVHPNHINLILSSNELHRRNIGEDLARRMEATLGLPNLWMDSLHGEAAQSSTTTISSVPIDAKMSRILKESHITGFTATGRWLADLADEVTAKENLFLAAVATSDMEPSLSSGDIVIVDGAVKAYVGESIYIIAVAKDSFLRRIKKSVTGSYTVSTGHDEEKLDSLKGINVVGRIVRRIQMMAI